MAPLALSSPSGSVPRRRSQRNTQDTAMSDYRASDQDILPLRSMAERVGKEVERFAESIDSWHRDVSRDNATPLSRHRSTMRLVDRLVDEAANNVHSLKKKLASEKKGAPNKRLIRVRETDDNFNPPEEDEDDLGFGDEDTPARLKRWRSEAATWNLLQTMLSQNVPEPGRDLEADKRQRLQAMTPLDAFTPEEEIWDRFLAENDTAQERELILQWLESTADESGEDLETISNRVGNETGRGTGAWTQGLMDTKMRIKQEKLLHNWNQSSGTVEPEITRKETGELIVSQLDPDAPTRQNRALETSDERHEAGVWSVIWDMVRRGKSWKEIKDWCAERNEQWRSVSLGKSYANDYARTPLRCANSGLLWRRICYAASQAGQSDFERAVYGIMAGDVASVEPICHSWDDALYARMNALLLCQLDQYLAANFPDRMMASLTRPNPRPDLLQLSGGDQIATASAVQSLSERPSTRAESREPIKMIQGSLIRKTFGDFAFQLGIALSKRASAENGASALLEFTDAPVQEAYLSFVDDWDALRIATHIWIICNSLGMVGEDNQNRALYENIIVSYTTFLRLAGKIELVPLYAMQLPDDRANMVLGMSCIDIRNFEEQKTQVKLMQGLNLDVDEVIGKQFEYTMARVNLASRRGDFIAKYEILEPTSSVMYPGHRIKENFLDEDITADEDMLIRSCEWWMHVPGRWSETFTTMAEALKEFLLSGRVGAAVCLVERMPFSQVSKIKTTDMPRIGKAIDVVEEDVPEHEMIEAEPDLRRSGRVGRQAPAHKRAISPKRLEENRIYLEILRDDSRTYYSLQQLVNAITMLDEWKLEEQGLLKYECNLAKARGAPMPPKTKIRELLEEVIAAFDPLLDDFLSVAMDGKPLSLNTRLIRRIYLPELILAYNSVLHSAAPMLSREHTMKCMDLASAVAADRNECVQRAFLQSGRMKEAVQAFARSSLLMVKLDDERSLAQKKGQRRKRSPDGEYLALWNVQGAVEGQ
ncbi:hypothetical protein K490DRAFT_51300 [Saccharata proteae CBS 121410]|uniref:Nuclear pore complex protein n=1 Tax=Saccharata proteae CBS 121410 TaxID=1314787 RepID=A0A9P4LUZ2_9PEZI|nr:hypothetical protein K490DRAFT_51300 [Saccharata proteae CBS 121410]